MKKVIGQVLHVVKNVFSGLREGYGGYMHRANIQMDCDRVSENVC